MLGRRLCQSIRHSSYEQLASEMSSSQVEGSSCQGGVVLGSDGLWTPRIFVVTYTFINDVYGTPSNVKSSTLHWKSLNDNSRNNLKLIPNLNQYEFFWTLSEKFNGIFFLQWYSMFIKWVKFYWNNYMNNWWNWSISSVILWKLLLNYCYIQVLNYTEEI